MIFLNLQLQEFEKKQLFGLVPIMARVLVRPLSVRNGKTRSPLDIKRLRLETNKARMGPSVRFHIAKLLNHTPPNKQLRRPCFLHVGEQSSNHIKRRSWDHAIVASCQQTRMTHGPPRQCW